MRVLRSGGVADVDVLLVDDDPAVLRSIARLLETAGVACTTAASPEEALALLGERPVGVMIQDMNFSPGKQDGAEGEALFRAARKEDPDLPVVMLTGFTSLEAAVRLVREGAADYMAKPPEPEKLVPAVRNLLELRRLRLDYGRLDWSTRRAKAKLAERFDLCGLVYASRAMHEVVSVAVHVAPSDAPVLITGPSGTGKELVASIVQANSRRRAGPFVKLNAAALPSELIEAEIFGAEPGAYTGASKRRIGRFEQADGGTLFIDELGNLALPGQMKLLRILQTGEFERLGSGETRKADVRTISATNSDLHRAIERGEFREDLYYRLNVIELRVPPLRERPEDVPLLVEHFLATLPFQGERPRPSARAWQAVREHDWPGNVRELENRLQRAMLLAVGKEIEPSDLDLVFGTPEVADSATFPRASAMDAEALEIAAALEDADYVVAHAAKRLGVTRQALYRRMERLGLGLERRPRRGSR